MTPACCASKKERREVARPRAADECKTKKSCEVVVLLSSQRVQAKLLLVSAVWAILLLYCCLQNGAQVLANGMAQSNAN